MEDITIIRSWRQQISRNFFIVRYLKAYTVFMSEKPSRLYGVLSLLDTIEDISKHFFLSMGNGA
jgi:hypothetical protein